MNLIGDLCSLRDHGRASIRQLMRMQRAGQKSQGSIARWLIWLAAIEIAIELAEDAADLAESDPEFAEMLDQRRADTRERLERELSA